MGGLNLPLMKLLNGTILYKAAEPNKHPGTYKLLYDDCELVIEGYKLVYRPY